MLHRTLIAEDDAALQTLFTKAFEYAGFQVCVASNGDEALSQINLQLPEVLILDLGLPGKSGLEVLKQLRRHEQYERQRGSQSHVNVIIVTGNDRASDTPEAQLADLFLLKPVSITELVRLAERIRTTRRGVALH